MSIDKERRNKIILKKIEDGLKNKFIKKRILIAFVAFVLLIVFVFLCFSVYLKAPRELLINSLIVLFVALFLYKVFSFFDFSYFKTKVKLNELLIIYEPLGVNEYIDLQQNVKQDPKKFIELLRKWVELEKKYYEKESLITPTNVLSFTERKIDGSKQDR